MTSLHCFAASLRSPVIPLCVGFKMMLSRSLCRAAKGVQSTLYLDHKPWAVSLRQFRHREALGLPYLSVD